MKVVVPSWMARVKIENNNGETLQDSPELESRFGNILNELEAMKKETKCGTCKDTFGEMIETGERYKKIQEITDRMAERGYKAWQEVPKDEKTQLKKAVGLV